MKIKLHDVSILAAFGILFTVLVLKLFWVLVPASDALEYLGPVLAGSTYNAWPWLDRVFLASALKVFATVFPGSQIHLGPSYALCISLLCYGLGASFIYLRQGFSAALTFAVLFMSSYYVMFFSTQIFPEPLLVLVTLIAAICYLQWQRTEAAQWLMAAGVCSGLAVTTKITGVAVPLAFFVLILRDKKYGALTRYATGIAFGAVFAFLLFALFFGTHAALDVVSGFFASNVKENLTGRAGYNNAVSFWDVFFNRLHIPVFIGMLIFTGIYRHPRARVFATLGWSYFFVVYGIYLLSGRGFTPIPNYVYPAYFAFLMALSFVFAETLALPEPRQRWRLTAWLLATFVVSFILSQGIDPARMFEAGFDPNLHSFRKLVTNGSLMLVIPLFVLCFYRPTKWLLVSALSFAALWGGLYATPQALHLYTQHLIPESRVLYEAAPLLNLPTADTFDVYIPEWRDGVDEVRLKHIFRVFFNTKYAVDKNDPRSYRNLQELVAAKIGIHPTAQSLVATERPVLTSSPAALKALWGDFKLVQELEFSGLKLSLIERTSGSKMSR
jgi:4-amino-4-deoxy-L-arabinose transferase-like glycosyltransferase